MQAALQNNLKPGAPTSTTAQPLRQHPDNKHLHQTPPTTTNKQTTSKEHPSNTHPRVWGQGWEARGEGSRASPGCRSLRSSTAGMLFILAAANPYKDLPKKVLLQPTLLNHLVSPSLHSDGRSLCQERVWVHVAFATLDLEGFSREIPAQCLNMIPT